MSYINDTNYVIGKSCVNNMNYVNDIHYVNDVSCVE